MSAAAITTEATERVVALVAEVTLIGPADILSRYRTAPVAQARFIVYHLLREVLRWSLPRIAEGTQRDHGAVMNGLSRLQTWRKHDQALNDLISDLEKRSRPIALWCSQQFNQSRQQRAQQALGLLALQNLLEALPSLSREQTRTLQDRLSAHLRKATA